MIELELFYNKAVSKIREKQADYLKKQKAQPFQQVLPEVVEITPEEWAKLRLFHKFAYRWALRKQRRAVKKAMKRQKRPVDDVLTKGYNAGIEMALAELERQFVAYSRTLELSK